MDRRVMDWRPPARGMDDRRSPAGRGPVDRPPCSEEISFAEQFRRFLRRNANWFLIGALSLLLLQDIFGRHGVLAMRRSQQQAAQVQNEINQLNDENHRLQDRVKSLKSDPASIERIAREEMGLARPGEYIFKNQPAPGDAKAAGPSESGPVPQPDIPEKKN